MKINKRVALSFLTIAGTLTAVVGITFAAFSDTATLTGNTLSTSTPNLLVATSNYPDCTSYSSSRSGISSTNLAPGESGSMNFCLKNSSTGDLAFNVTAVGTITSGSLDPSLVSVTVDCGFGPKNVKLDGSTQSDVIVNIPAGNVATCVIKQAFSSSATNSASNQNIHYDVTFTGTQS